MREFQPGSGFVQRRTRNIDTKYENIIEHKKNGILVNIDDKQEMEKAIRLLEKDKLLRKQISKNAFETLKNKYSIQVYKKNLFSEIIKTL